MRLAHLSDVHVNDLTNVRWTRFVNKRLTGLINLMGHRKNAHPRHMLESAVAELADDTSIDHVVVTGDLTNLALESEMRAARAILEPLAPRLSVIPGNHDVYTRGSERTRRFEQIFGDWMFGPDAPAQTYPWHKRISTGASIGPDLHLLGFSSAVARAPFIATGVVSAAQFAHLDTVAATPGFTDPNAVRVALVHHNLHARGWRKDAMHGLSNRDAFLDALKHAKVDLLLHGHTHVAHRATLRGVEVIGCGSTTWASPNPTHLGRYNVYTFGRPATTAALTDVEVRLYDTHTQRFSGRLRPALDT